MTKPACAGLWELFDSVNLHDHQTAKAICKSCPLLAACLRKVPARGEYPTGTWAASLYREGIRVPGELPPDKRKIAPRAGGLPACTYCGAAAGKPCHTPRGTHTAPHTARLPETGPATRLCDRCGDVEFEVKGNLRFCDECRIEQRRETWREYRRRREAKQRAGRRAA